MTASVSIAACEAALDRLEHPAAGLRRLAGGAERPAAGDLLEDDPAPALLEPLGQQSERHLDAFAVLRGGFCELGDRERLRGDDQQGLERAGKTVERVGCD